MKAPQDAAVWLLDGLRADEVFFASPLTLWRSRGAAQGLRVLAPVSEAVVRGLFEQAAAQGQTDAVLFGLVPFDVREPASLFVPADWQQAPVPTQKPALQPTASRPAVLSQTPVPAPEVYGDMVRAALRLYAEEGVRKIVLSRAMDVALDAPPALPQVLADLLGRNAQGYTFALPIWGEGGGEAVGAMLGASPELLVRREGDRVFINPLAGSIGRHTDPAIDQARREGLATSEKDLREHSYVVQDIVRILRMHCDELQVPPGPSVIGTDALWHLSTFISGRLRDPGTSALTLACALHPTPAICGYPTAQAFEHIRALEPFERDYFTGLVGWQRANGDGEWALTLRCARYDGQCGLRLYAGAGTVAGSDPESETRETGTKMQTFMRAIV